MTNAQRNRRSIARVFKVIKPIVGFFGSLQKGQLSLEEFSKLTIEQEQAMFTRDKIVDRTVTSATFADLLNTWNVQANITKLFSRSEIAAINASVPN